MVYGIIQLINFAHGEVLMVGATDCWTGHRPAAAMHARAWRAGWC
jgi:branched-subunit amino acid ABC-type transport system permease component